MAKIFGVDLSTGFTLELHDTKVLVYCKDDSETISRKIYPLKNISSVELDSVPCDGADIDLKINGTMALEGAKFSTLRDVLNVKKFVELLETKL